MLIPPVRSCHTKYKQKQAGDLRPQPISSVPRNREEDLLNLDSSASFLELLHDSVCFFLGNPFLDRGGSAFDQVLGFLQAEARDLAYCLDHRHLLRTERGE